MGTSEAGGKVSVTHGDRIGSTGKAALQNGPISTPLLFQQEGRAGMAAGRTAGNVPA